MKSTKLLFLDPLTNIYNKDFFFESGKQILQIAKRNQEPLSISIIEVDNFKALNEKEGDTLSGELLKWLAITINGQCRKSDLLCRLDMNKYALLMYSTTSINAEIFLDSFRKKIETNGYDFQDKHINITISIGISLIYNQIDEYELKNAYKRAEIALARAYKKGQNCTVVY